MENRTFLVVAILVAIAVSISVFTLEGKKEKEYVNPGAPRSPVDLTDFFKIAEDKASYITIEEVLKEAPYPILLRVDRGKIQEPKFIWINPQTLDNGKVIYGYSFRWSDRVQLAVDPVSEPLDVGAILSEEMLPNTKGETKINFECRVREIIGGAHEKGEQKWQSGAIHRYPAVLFWTEKGTGEIPYLLYTVYGDTTVEELKEIAESLKAFE